MSPESSDGNKKNLAIGDCFTSYAIAVPVKNEQAVTIAENLLVALTFRYGPPENLLSDKGHLSRAVCWKNYVRNCG